MNDKKLVMCGCHEAGWDIIRFLLKNGIKFSYFVTITEEKALQQKVSGYKSFYNLAQEYRIPVYYAKKYSLKSDEDLRFFSENKFDLLVQGGWQRLFPEDILKTLKIGAIGGHGSADFLPMGRGRSPLNWSLIEGQQRIIMQYFLIKPGVDDGDIFHYDFFDINEWDDIQTLYYKISLLTGRVLLQWIPRLLAGNFSTIPQHGKPSYYPKRNPEDGMINWMQSPTQVYNFIRALTRPYPGAFSFINNKKLMIWKGHPFDSKIDDPSWQIGEIVKIFSSGDFVVKCKGGLFIVTDYEMEDKALLKEGLLFDATG
ncbi:MAG TPA: formyltransferase family protein [Chitinophagales bacterium]|nr:formyltransferase family protein [Chitinophagales bacterium]